MLNSLIFRYYTHDSVVCQGEINTKIIKFIRTNMEGIKYLDFYLKNAIILE